MKFTIHAHTRADGIRVVRAHAVIKSSKKLGILRRAQKTWSVRTVAPEFCATEHRAMFEAEANRWEAKVLPALKGVVDLHSLRNGEQDATELTDCDRRIGSSGVWKKVREGIDADGSWVVIAQLEVGLDETDFGKTEWLNMPKAANTH